MRKAIYMYNKTSLDCNRFVVYDVVHELQKQRRECTKKETNWYGS